MRLVSLVTRSSVATFLLCRCSGSRPGTRRPEKLTQDRPVSWLKIVGALLTLALLTATTPLYAQASKDEWDGGFNGPKATRRSNVVIGLRVAPTLGWARGYPNEASMIDDPQYLSNTHTGWGTDDAFWIGGALRDWFTFAIGAEEISFRRNSLTASGGAFTLRTEIYPAWSLGCAWRDLGVAMDFGLGGMKMTRNGAPRADGGSVGLAGFEVFHELLRRHGFAWGPALGYRQVFSQSLTANITVLGTAGCVLFGAVAIILPASVR